MMKTKFAEKLYISTIDSRAAELAQEYGLGIELSQFCYAPHMDELFSSQEADVENCLDSAERFVLHAPFAELHPSAIDPLVLGIAKKRFRQAAELARKYGVKRMVVHSGYVPNVYFKEWFTERSVAFWKEFLEELPNDFELLLENVMDDEPQTLKRVAEAVQAPRFGLCLDVGHVNAISDIPPCDWIAEYGTMLKHVHLHNNHGVNDEHGALFEGDLDILSVLEAAQAASPEATFTLELMDAEPSLRWLAEKGLI
ncbi:MAG: sugar phosphate isomerase/epimerase [Christensenellaceae bacterium]|nr:sugar phosphate isomerase/epimerase [Christensenellaceae bacterium]